MTDVFPFILSLVVGVCAGVLFFEGLWRTVIKAVANARPVYLILLSFTIRAILLLAVLWVASRGNAFRLAACLLGFLAGRTMSFRIHRGGKPVAN